MDPYDPLSAPARLIERPRWLWSIRDAAELAVIAYAAPADMMDRLRGFPRCRSVQLFHSGSTEGYALQTDEGVIVTAFQGSKFSRHDWLSNLWALPKRVPRICKIKYGHAGYCNAIAALWDGLAGHYEMLAGSMAALKAQRFAFVGHSKGGAEAQVAASFLRNVVEVPMEQMRVYTFGSPRVWGYATGSPIGHTRIAAADDLVPMVPLLPFYLHTGDYLWVDRENNLVPMEPAMAPLRHLWGAISSGHPLEYVIDAISEHPMRRYRDAIEIALQRMVDDYGSGVGHD